jgi:hypothetical protein
MQTISDDSMVAITQNKRVRTLLRNGTNANILHLQLDLTHLISGLRSAVLIDYMETQPSVLEKHLKDQFNSLQLLSIIAGDVELHYFVNSHHLSKRLHNTPFVDAIFINADPKLTHPCVCIVLACIADHVRLPIRISQKNCNCSLAAAPN